MRAKRYHVYHRMHMDLMIRFGDLPEQVAQSDYQEVAVVRAEELEEVFTLTNHRSEDPWWRHPDVTPTSSTPAYRSTSVGDVIQQGRQVWIVQNVGWGQVTWAREETSIPTVVWQKLVAFITPGRRSSRA